MHRELISRRDLARRCIAAVAAAAVPRAAGQQISGGSPGSAFGDLPVRLIKEIKSAYLFDLSPDGTKLCVYTDKTPVRSFRSTPQGRWDEKTPVRGGDEALRVVEFGSWTQIYALRLREKAAHASFFSDSEALYVESSPILGFLRGATQRLVIEIRTGKYEERLDPFDGKGDLAFSYSALEDRTLLGTGFNTRTKRIDLMVKVKGSSYEELRRAALTETGPAGTGTIRELRVSADRRTFVYCVDNNIVCRAAEDLRTRWSRQTDPDLLLPHVAVSADGGVVAASARSNSSPELRKRSHVGVYEGRDGDPIITVPVYAEEAIAISPNRRVLAVGQRLEMAGKKSGTQPTVLLFDVDSGERISTLIHDQFRDGGSEFLYAGLGNIQFTPDSKHLITSGLNTKIWEIG